MSDFLEIKAKRTEIAPGLGRGGSILVLVDTPTDTEDIDSEGDGKKLAEWLYTTVPYRTLDFAIKELGRREEA